MAAPAYTTDLVTVDTAETITAWAEPTATGWTGGGTPAQDSDYPYIQGSYAVLQGTTKSGIAAVLCNSGGAITLPTDGAFLVWQNFYSPGPVILDTYANGGLRLLVGSSLAAFDSWDVGGNDVGRNPYGGWQNLAVNPTVQYDDRVSTGAGNYQYIGSAVNLLAGIGKGYPHNIDVIRYGRCEARFSGGDLANGYAVITGFQALNDATSARWGLIQKIPYGFLWKGLISLGESNKTTATRARNTNVATITFSTAHKFKVGDVITVANLGGTGYNGTWTVASVPATTSLTYANTGSNEGSTADTNGTVGCIVDFRDSNRLVFIDDTRKVTSSFNRMEVKHASSRVDLTGYSFICISPSTTASRGSLAAIEDADVNIDSCLFQDMDTFVFQAGSTIISSIFRRCNQVTQGGAAISNTQFGRSTAAVALSASALNNLDTLDFISAGTGHAIEATSSGAANWNYHTLSGYAASDGDTGNEAFCNNSGDHIDLTILGGDTPSVRNIGDSTTDLIFPEVTLVISAQVSLVGAEIRIYDLDDSLPDLGTELAGTESHDAATYTYNGVGGNVIWIQIMLTGYEEYGQEFTMPDANGDLAVILKPELNA